MQLKPEFKDSITSLLASKSKPVDTAENGKHSHPKPFADSAVAADGKIHLEGATPEPAPEKQSFYETLQSNDGFLALQEYFLRSLNEGREDEGAAKTGPPALEADEYAFGRLMLGVMGNIDEIYMLDTFDTIDSRCSGTIGYKEFYLCVMLMAAKEEGMTTHALYLHGQRFFDMISAGQEVVSEERLLKFGRVIGFREEVLLDNLTKLLGKDCTMVNCEDFVTFYYYLFSQYDQSFQSYRSKSVEKQVPMQKFAVQRVRSGCCTGRVCSIV